MPAIPLARGRYRRSENIPVRLDNMLYETDPTNTDDQVSLITRPGMGPFATLGGAYVAGMIGREDAAESLLAVAGTDAYDLSSAGVITAAGGGIAGTGRIRAATDGVNVMIIRAGILYAQAEDDVAPIEMPDDIQALDVVFLSSRFWIATALDGRIYFTEPGETEVDALNYFSAEGTPDGLRGLATSGGELLALGRSSIEYFNPSPDQDLPAQRAQGRFSNVGVASVHSIASGDVGKVAVWVGDDNVVYRGGDALPIDICDEGLSETIRKARAALDDTDPTKTLFGRSFSIDKREVYLLDIPGVGTMACDLKTGQWSAFTTVQRGLFAGGCTAKLSQGRWAIGGTYDNKVRLLSPNYHDDDGSPIVRVWTGLTRSRIPLRFSNVQTECSVGGASLTYPTDNPQLAMRYSDNGAKAFSDFVYVSLGLQGRYNNRPTFKNPNRMPSGYRVWEFRMSDPIPFTVQAASYSERVR